MKSVHSDEYHSFRLLLIHARKTAGLTQSDLAATLARPQSFVSKYERGERRLDVIEFLDVTKAIGIDPCVVLKQIANRKRPRSKAKEV